jgi:hypothetical protein
MELSLPRKLAVSFIASKRPFEQERMSLEHWIVLEIEFDGSDVAMVVR